MKTTKNKIVYEENINGIEGKAIAVVFPDSIEEIKNIVKFSPDNVDIVPRGAGTSFVGGVIPQNSIVIDMSKMNKIIDINPARKIAIVEAGILVSELNEELEQYDLEFPIETLFAGIETLGGIIAKNSAGNREIKYGRAIKWINQLEAINGKGEHIRVSKSDLSDFVGMEGTTGIIVKATLHLTNKKKRSFTILKALSLEDVFAVNKKLRLNQDVSSIDLLSREVSSLLGLEKKYHIFIEFENNEGNFKAENYEKYLKLKQRVYKAIASDGYFYMGNAKLLTDSLYDFLVYLEENQIPYFGHLASGVIYPFFKPENIGRLQELSNFVKKLKGRVCYNFGIGLTKKDFVELGEKELIKRVKRRYDPKNKFNKGKLIDFTPSTEIKIEIQDKTLSELTESTELTEQTELAKPTRLAAESKLELEQLEAKQTSEQLEQKAIANSDNTLTREYNKDNKQEEGLK